MSTIDGTGVGVLLHWLGGGTPHSSEEYYGKRIKAARLVHASSPERFIIEFEGGPTIHIQDAGQSCCEERYLVLDDDPQVLVGGVLQEIRVKDGPNLPSKYSEEHESAFIEIQTDKSQIVLTTHVEHNGYYGGFALEIQEK